MASTLGLRLKCRLTMRPNALLQLIDVHKSFRSGTEAAPIAVLRGANLMLAGGESVAIVGPSGSGKSTLLNLLGALDRPEQGQVMFEGQDLAALSDSELAAFRNQKVGFIFQSHHLLPHCNVLENVLVPVLAQRSVVPATFESRARKLLERVGLQDRITHWPGQLSGGERQRVAVVRALINEPPLLLADEPTGALDRDSAASLTRLLLELNQEEKVALIVVTHSPSLADRMQRTLTLGDGQLRETSITRQS